MKVLKNPPKATAWLFPEYDFPDIDPGTHRGVIIERILERGTWNDINWLLDQYGETPVREWVRLHGYRALSRRSFALWRLVFGLHHWQAPEWARGKRMDPW